MPERFSFLGGVEEWGHAGPKCHPWTQISISVLRRAPETVDVGRQEGGRGGQPHKRKCHNCLRHRGCVGDLPYCVVQRHVSQTPHILNLLSFCHHVGQPGDLLFVALVRAKRADPGLFAEVPRTGRVGALSHMADVCRARKFRLERLAGHPGDFLRLGGRLGCPPGISFITTKALDAFGSPFKSCLCDGTLGKLSPLCGVQVSAQHTRTCLSIILRRQ